MIGDWWLLLLGGTFQLSFLSSPPASTTLGPGDKGSKVEGWRVNGIKGGEEGRGEAAAAAFERKCWSFFSSLLPFSPLLRSLNLEVGSTQIFHSPIHKTIKSCFFSGQYGWWGCWGGGRSSSTLDPDGQEVVFCRRRFRRWRRRRRNCSSMGEDGQEESRIPTWGHFPSYGQQASGPRKRVNSGQAWWTSTESWLVQGGWSGILQTRSLGDGCHQVPQKKGAGGGRQGLDAPDDTKRWKLIFSLCSFILQTLPRK